MSGALFLVGNLARLETHVTGPLTPLDAVLLCEGVEKRGEAIVGDVRVLFAAADHVVDRAEEYRHALRMLAAYLDGLVALCLSRKRLLGKGLLP